MWKLVHKDGSLFRDGYPTQWEALRTCRKKDGSHFTKSQALKKKSGTIVYHEKYESRLAHSHTVDANGERGKSYVKKLSVPVLEEFTLINEDE